MSEQRYYYIKLKENFFESDEMMILEAMPDGYLYSNILIKLYLRSLKNEGKLMFNDVIPYNAQMIATITRHQIGTVERALGIFKELGLIDVLDNGAIYMLNIQNYIGTSSTEADRMRDYRNRVRNEKKALIEDKVAEPKQEEKPKKRFVPPTVEEVRAYCNERKNNVSPEHFIAYYEANGWTRGKNGIKIKDWKACVRTWECNEGKYSRNSGKGFIPAALRDNNNDDWEA